MKAQTAPIAAPSPERVIDRLLYVANPLMYGPERKAIVDAVATIQRLAAENAELRAARALREEKFQDESLDPQGEPDNERSDS